MSTVKTQSTKQYVEIVNVAKTICPGSMSSVQYDAFLKHFAKRDMLKTLKLKSSADALKLAKREIVATREQKLAASIACNEIASTLKIDNNKFWSRKLYAFVAVETQSRKTRKRAAKQS